MDQNGPLEAKMDQDGPFWSILVSRMLKSSSDQAILTKMVAWTILDHFGPVHFPTVLRSLPKNCLKRPQLVTQKRVGVCTPKKIKSEVLETLAILMPDLQSFIRIGQLEQRSFGKRSGPFLRWTVLGSSRGPCYQRDFPMQGMFC